MTTNLARRFGAVMGALDITARGLAGVALIVELVVVLSDVSARSFLGFSLLWSHEVSEISLSVITFVGGCVAYRAGHHSAVRVITDKMPASSAEYVLLAIEHLILVLACTVLYSAEQLMEINRLSTMPVLGIEVAWLDLPAVIGMVMLILFCLENILSRYERRKVLRVAPVALVATAGVMSLYLSGIMTVQSNDALLIMLAAFFVGVLLGLPVAFSMIFSSLLFLLVSGQAPVIALAQNMVDGSTSSFILLALPFFIFVGLIMERGGISTKLVAWAMAMVGHLRGGILQVMVVTTYLVAGISGSKTADVAAVGSVMRAELVKRGYKQEEGAAVLSAATAMSETIPPSIGMLVLGSVTPISIGTLFLAGIIPAAVVASCIMLAIYLITRLRGERPGQRASGRVMVASAIRAIPAMIMPAIMIIGIRAGIATPTEVSAVAAFYGVLLAVVIYHAIGWKDFCKVTAESAVISGMVLFIIAAAFAFSWALSAAYLPQQLVSFVHGTSKAVFLIESIFFLIIIGSLLEGLPALIILGPLLLPLATELGVGSVHYAILLLLAMGVGIFMPPLGVGFYVATAVLESKLEPAAKAMLPFLGVLLIGILLVAFVPWFTNVLPGLFE